jgi:hypothetical protein
MTNKPSCRGARALAAAATLASMAGCANFSIGIGLPIGGIGGVGVSVGSDGRVGGSVGVGSGPVTVGVGGSTTLPAPSAGPAASAPASAPAR